MISFVPSTPIGFALFALILGLGPKRGLWALFVAMPFGATAVFSASGIGNVVLLDFCAMAYVLSVVMRVTMDDTVAAIWPGSAGFPLLMLCVFVALGGFFLPQVFAGKSEVYAIHYIDGRAFIDLSPLAPTGANIAQMARFLMGALLFLALLAVPWIAQDWRIVACAVAVASGAHIAVSVVDWVTFPLGLNDLLDPIRTIHQAVLVDQKIGAVRRIIGGYTEPASFGIYTIGLYGFWLSARLGGLRLAGAGLLLFCTALLALRSTSTATIANLIIFTTVFVLWHGRELARSRVWITASAIAIASFPILVAGAAALLTYSSTAQALIDAVFWNKAGSTSGQERFSWNMQALQNFRDSYGLGLGIGSVRASGWGFSVLGNLGLPGVLAFSWFLVKALRPRDRSFITKMPLLETADALRWGAVAILMQSVLTTPFPNLGLPFFALIGLAVGLDQARVRSSFCESNLATGIRANAMVV